MVNLFLLGFKLAEDYLLKIKNWQKMLLIQDILMQLLSGGDHDIDVVDLRNNTCYSGGYSEGSRNVKIFWEVRAWIMDFFFHT